MNRRISRKCLRKRTILIVAIIIFAIFNIFTNTFRELPENAINTISSTPQSTSSSTISSTPQSTSSSTISSTPRPTSSCTTSTTSPQLKSSSTVNHTAESELPMNGSVTYYQLVKDQRYHYEFRFEYNRNSANDDPRLMILLNGSRRTCVDYWEFSVGRRILATLHSFRFLILAICSKRKKFDPDGPVENNPDVKWIYFSLQKWMNEVYYKQFQRYPRLYLHGISRGSKFAGLLCRVLPIQGQILTISPGHREGLLTRSDHSIDLQTRLQLDPIFANWFYFDFCFNKKINPINISELCPFQNNRRNYQPIPPTYFIHPKNDALFTVSDYTSIIDQVRRDAFHLGGTLLNHTETMKLYILPPSNATRTYMQEVFDIWRYKPHASSIFYEHYINRRRYKPSTMARVTCLCLNTDLRHFELHPKITETWSKQKQEEYRDYAHDVKQFETWFCEEVCGDLHAHHAIASRDLDKALYWTSNMDYLRHSFYIKDYLSRPLRIWMYEKNSIITKTKYFSSNEPNYVNISKQYDIYSPEYYLQEYFQQLKASSAYPRHNLQWASNPLLADYFIIPSDLTYYYFYPDVNTMMRDDFQHLVHRLNTDYFATLLRNVQNIFPFWTMAKRADQMGSNHILTILTGRNMGIFYNHTQNLLKNVVQVVFTGLRQDMLPPDTPPPRDYRGTIIVYRHGYDVVIPQFTRLKPNRSLFLNLTALVTKKKRLFFFAGSLDHTMTQQSARPRLWSVWKKNITTEIQGKQFDTVTIIQGHQKPADYIESIQTSVFSLCPEGFFPWSARFYESIQIGTIPMILADNIVLPFERFIDWPSFSIKINVSNIENITDYARRIDNIDEYIRQKLRNAFPYMRAFQWPYSAVGENGQNKHVFLPDEDRNGSERNVFHYISLELRCRRLEQLYGLTSDSFSMKSIRAQQRACRTHATICPCHDAQQSVAFREYF